MIYVYGEKHKPSEWVKCKLLHEFLESYQIEFRDPATGEKKEKVVHRDLIRQVYNADGQYDRRRHT